MDDRTEDDGEQVRPRRLVRCTFEGCPKTSEHPGRDGWGALAGWGSGVSDGLYCLEHVALLEDAVTSARSRQGRGGRFSGSTRVRSPRNGGRWMMNALPSATAAG